MFYLEEFLNEYMFTILFNKKNESRKELINIRRERERERKRGRGFLNFLHY